ncbi:gamma-glutamyltransferase family protein [Roseitranquillus sediminis]|uniref:gamma-glutamyltransferase family protein n=1 Tax=Roseitranquillus sediminis TaxID=2809051 RepID=UPI001D0C0EE5|nr:gamma-glutamyltransferase family protein [Roseitranquillus sediminis]MBM9595458.1 gamma-glutamyltransferase family protein [Roseitranquillus sediminis]
MDFSTFYPVRRVPLLARNVVATSQPLAAQAGLSMLHAGGNAVDAALAAAITLTVVEPTGNGVGSDAFAIIWDGSELHGLNSSGRSPAGWTPARFAGGSAMPQRGWESVTVPGAVAAWIELSERFGTLPFEALFAPAIRYARDGFALSPTVATVWAKGAEALKDQPGFADHFMPDGRAPRAGELFRNPDLARTLEAIAESRGRALYEGALAEALVANATQHGAALTLDDLAAHQADWCGTLSTSFAGAELHEIPPNGQGIAALMALGILRHTQLADHAPDSVQSMHLQIEATKLALADLDRYVSDPATMQVSYDALLEDDYLASRAALIGTTAGDPGAGAPKAGGTVFLTAADEAGRMISFIQSNYSGFGSGVVVPGTGIHLQNRGSGFTLEPGHPNEVGPRKRPFHTIIPGFVMRDGAPAMSFGVMGGPMQAQGHVQMMVRTALHGQNPQAASDAPRWRVTEGRELAIEWEMPSETVDGLGALGHSIKREAPDNAFGFGGAQLIARTEAGYVAGSDHRKDGCAVGF